MGATLDQLAESACAALLGQRYSIDDAVSLLHAIKPHARSTDEPLAIATEDQEELADALIALGATLRVETMHMRGPLR